MPWVRITVQSAMTIAAKEARVSAAPMPSTIMIGDVIRLRDGKVGIYTRAYGAAMKDAKWTVTHIDHVVGRKRLYVADTPSAIYAGHAILAYKAQSKTRRDILTKAGVRLP